MIEFDCFNRIQTQISSENLSKYERGRSSTQRRVQQCRFSEKKKMVDLVQNSDGKVRKHVTTTPYLIKLMGAAMFR